MRKNKSHRKFINSLPCVSCQALPPSECSHVRRNTDGGTGIKPSDEWTIPQCHNCHEKVDFIITRDNADKFKALCLSLYNVSGDWQEGVKLILEFRRTI